MAGRCLADAFSLLCVNAEGVGEVGTRNTQVSGVGGEVTVATRPLWTQPGYGPQEATCGDYWYWRWTYLGVAVIAGLRMLIVALLGL